MMSVKNHSKRSFGKSPTNVSTGKCTQTFMECFAEFLSACLVQFDVQQFDAKQFDAIQFDAKRFDALCASGS